MESQVSSVNKFDKLLNEIKQTIDNTNGFHLLIKRDELMGMGNLISYLSFSVIQRNREIADFYDISCVENKPKEINRIYNIVQSNLENNPYYIFLYDGHCWKGITIGFNEIEYHKPRFSNPLFEHLSFVDYVFDVDFELWDTSQKEIINRILNCNERYLKQRAYSELRNMVEEWSNSLGEPLFIKRVLDVLNDWDENNAEYVFLLNRRRIFLKRDKEDELFRAILGPAPKGTIYKYTTFSTVEHILNDSSHSMCSIICMNDRTESNYADNSINQNRRSQTIKGNKVVDDGFSVQLSFDNYITSFSEFDPHKLKMWRLYGENGKGVAIAYSAESMNLNDEFILAPVSYQNENGTHIELDFIRDLISHSFFGLQLSLNRWYMWQRFFKPYDYHEECEIRLVYSPIGKRRGNTLWVRANGIYSPMVVFPLNSKCDSYPLKILKIYLGPRFNEARINALLMNERLKENGLNFDIDTIEIDHYRVNEDN